MAFSVFDERILAAYITVITDAEGIAIEPVMTADPPGFRFDALLLSNDDAIPHVVWFGQNKAGNTRSIGSVSVPAGAGFGGLPAVDAVATIAPAALGGVLVPADVQLTWAVEVAVTPGQVVGLVAVGGGF